MFLLRLIRYLMGYVRFTASGGHPEKFLSGVARQDVMLWNIKSVNGELKACTLARNFKKLKSPADSANVRLKVDKCVGLPFRAKKYSKRSGLLTGALLFVGLIWFFSSFVWTVNVTGNTSVSAAEITDVLSDLGLRPGTFPMMVNVKQIEQQALIRLPDISWMAININGSNAQVKVKERKYPPDVVPEDMPCNVKASQSGTILSIEVYRGKAMKRAGDSIAKGDLLISGVVTDKFNTVMLLHASGKAVARTQHDLEVTVPFKQQVKLETGKPVTKNTLGVFNLNIPLYFSKPDGDYKVTMKTDHLNVLGLTLPFSVTSRTYTQLKETSVTYTMAQAGAIAVKQLEGVEKTELSGMKVTAKVTESKHDGNGYTLIGHYTCEEDIAFQEEIPLT